MPCTATVTVRDTSAQLRRWDQFLGRKGCGNVSGVCRRSDGLMGRELRYLAHGAMMRWPAVMQVDEFGFHTSANWGICESHSWATVAAAVCEVRDQDGDLCRGALELAQSKPQLCLPWRSDSGDVREPSWAFPFFDSAFLPDLDALVALAPGEAV